MLDQNLDFENLIIVVISLLALVMFIIMLVAAFVSLRSGRKARNSTIPSDTLSDTLTSARLSLQTYPQAIKTLNWVICLVVATSLAWLIYSRELFAVQRTAFYPFFIGLAMISPTCLAVVWLRLTGTKWRQALLLFIWVPVAFGGTLLIWQLANALFFYLGYGN